MIISNKDFTELFSKCGFEITDAMYNSFQKYAELLVEWNEKINLTAITDPIGISEKHFLDSILLLKFIDIPVGATLIDVGTGAGFPAIPIKIYRNDINVTLLDSLNKRINFLSTVSENLNLPMECVHSRAEDGGRNNNYREKYDFAVARAVAALPVLCEYCMPYVKVGGYFIALKGPNEDIKSAENAVKTLGGIISAVNEYSLPNGDLRMLISIKKIKVTPIKYPRSSALIKKDSL